MSLFVSRLPWLGIVLGLAFLVSSEPARGETVIRVVIISTAKLEGSDQDAKMVKELFEKGIGDQAKLEFAPPVRIPASAAKKAPIVQAIRDVVCNRDDVIVVYYSGHGGFSEALNEHVLTIGSEILPRSELRGLLISKRMKLGVILTDCCADVIPGKPAKPTINEANLQRTMKMLFLETRGIVDITSATTGERAWGEGSGGLFTRVFFETAWSKNQQAATWNAFFEEVKKGTQLRFLGFKEAQGENELLDVEERAFLASQNTQTPEAFQLGGWKLRAGDPAPPPAPEAFEPPAPPAVEVPPPPAKIRRPLPRIARPLPKVAPPIAPPAPEPAPEPAPPAPEPAPPAPAPKPAPEPAPAPPAPPAPAPPPGKEP